MRGAIDQLNRIPDDDFCAKLPDIMKYIWIDNKPVDIYMENELGISVEKLACIENLTFHTFNGLARGDITEEHARESMKVLSEKKLDILMNQIKIHRQYWRETMTFSDIQDTYFQTSTIIQQNNRLIKIMQELIETIEKIGLGKDEQSKQRR